MKLATFNLFQFVAPGHFWYEAKAEASYTPNDWQAKQEWIQKRLAEMDADVVGFQEVFSIEPLQALCHAAGYDHFATVDVSGTIPEDPRVFNRSVVALASRWPLKNIASVPLNTAVKHELRLGDQFQFSRLPVCAELEVPDAGNIKVCVVHLKSKRASALDIIYPEAMHWRDRSVDTLMRLSRASISSLIQRGAEATLLYHYVAESLLSEPKLPCAILGDLNDEADSSPFNAITMQDRIYEIGGITEEDWPETVAGYLHDYRLSDAFRLAPNMRQHPRPFTHIHRGQGTTLDHILVSNQFNANNPHALGEVLNYWAYNLHLNEDGIENRLQSDHGQVCVEILPIGDRANLPVLGRSLPESRTNLSTRQDFIDLAGGIYQTNRHYQQWSSSDKYEKFWSFFFDGQYGWVKSVYGDMPVSELRKREAHSIEHLIPLNFLDAYLINKRMPRHVRYGASTNPFNLAPSERLLNARRSSFPFDLDGDQIVRPPQLSMREDQAMAGFDAENEWVIPTRSRGYVARALLYMLLVYGIDELYQQHIDTLVAWAKSDPADPWEIAYNNWVQKRLGIRNPLMDTPEKANILLDNQELMYSMLASHHSLKPLAGKT